MSTPSEHAGPARRGCVGVCSWSLRPSSTQDLVRKVRDVGVRAVQLALDPIRKGVAGFEDAVRTLRDAGIEVPSGMMAFAGEDYSTLESIRRTGGVRDGARWPDHLRAAEDNASLAAQAGIPLVTFHAGFLPHDRNDPERGVMLERLGMIADRFLSSGVAVAFETGQETADTLLDLLADLHRPRVGVNFDPANMILYGMGDPVEALRRLASRVLQIHIKDAVPAHTPGVWGTEVTVGTGAVDWPAFLAIVRERLAHVNLMIEREAREDRVADCRTAREFVEDHLGPQRTGGARP